MINIFFVPGMFGSTLEYMLRNYTEEHDPVDAYITADGSMHTYTKEFHPNSMDRLLNGFNNNFKITTPIYPFPNNGLETIIESWPGNLGKSKNIFIKAKTLDDAELNILFQYHKIAKGVLRKGLDIFCGGNAHNIKNWNKTYIHWDQMEPWELREWLSMFYPKWVTEWINIESVIPAQSLIINNTDILKDISTQFVKIADFCSLSIKYEYDNFAKEWLSKQQYILDEFQLINAITDATLNGIFLDWHDKQLCFLSEAIIQKRLRSKGYELKCFELNTFPNNSKALYNILEKV